MCQSGEGELHRATPKAVMTETGRGWGLLVSPLSALCSFPSAGGGAARPPPLDE